MKSIFYKQVDKVCEIQVIDKRKKPQYQYYSTYKEKRTFKRALIHQDIFIMNDYYGLSKYAIPDIYTKEDILNIKCQGDCSKYLIEGNIVYSRPCVYLKFALENISSHTIYFDTFQEAQDWARNFILNNHLGNQLIKF